MYVRPKNFDEAIALMSQDTWRILAGGTDIYPSIGERHINASFIDLADICNLKGITEHDSFWKIGALTTWTELIKTKLPPGFNALKQAAIEIGSIQIQNRATIVGNICNASPAADGVPALMILNASVELASVNGIRDVALKDFIIGNRETVLKQDEIVSSIKVPKTDLESFSVFRKLGIRKYLVISMTMIALRMSIGRNGTIKRTALAVGACSAVAKRLFELEKLITGKTIREAIKFIDEVHLDILTPITDLRAPAAYRKTASKILIQRSIASFENIDEAE